MSLWNGGRRHTGSAVIACLLVAAIYSVARLSVSDVAATPAPPPLTIMYGDAPGTFGRLHRPQLDRAGEPAPVVVLLHGGFWRRRGGDVSLMEPLAVDLAARGYAVWNVEYGRMGERFGGWPHTFNHVAAAVDHLAVLGQDGSLDLGSVTIVGHSAGGHLALWAAGRAGFSARSAWDSAVLSASPDVVPSAVVALAPIVDLANAAATGLGNGAVADLLGGQPDAEAVRYAVAAAVPNAEVAVAIIVGGDDDTVPHEVSAPIWPGGDRAEWIVVGGEDHLRLISPTSKAWAAVVAELERAARS